MEHDRKQLNELARDYLWYMFTGEEIAELCNVSQNVVSKVKSLPDNPFFLNKCRPEWFLEWMRVHPRFQLTKAANRDSDSQSANSPTPSPESPKMIKQRKPRPKRNANQKPKTA